MFTFNVVITYEIITFQYIFMDKIQKDFMSIKDTNYAALTITWWPVYEIKVVLGVKVTSKFVNINNVQGHFLGLYVRLGGDVPYAQWSTVIHHLIMLDWL